MALVARLAVRHEAPSSDLADEVALAATRDVLARYPARDIVPVERNTRRRVYDALKVMVAVGCVQRDGKALRWIGVDHLQRRPPSSMPPPPPLPPAAVCRALSPPTAASTTDSDAEQMDTVTGKTGWILTGPPVTNESDINLPDHPTDKSEALDFPVAPATLTQPVTLYDDASPPMPDLSAAVADLRVSLCELRTRLARKKALIGQLERRIGAFHSLADRRRVELDAQAVGIRRRRNAVRLPFPLIIVKAHQPVVTYASKRTRVRFEMPSPFKLYSETDLVSMLADRRAPPAKKARLAKKARATGEDSHTTPRGVDEDDSIQPPAKKAKKALSGPPRRPGRPRLVRDKEKVDIPFALAGPPTPPPLPPINLPAKTGTESSSQPAGNTSTNPNVRQLVLSDGGMHFKAESVSDAPVSPISPAPSSLPEEMSEPPATPDATAGSKSGLMIDLPLSPDRELPPLSKQDMPSSPPLSADEGLDGDEVMVEVHMGHYDKSDEVKMEDVQIDDMPIDDGQDVDDLLCDEELDIPPLDDSVDDENVILGFINMDSQDGHTLLGEPS